MQKVVRGAADLVVEVISPSSHERDRIKKRDLYEQHGYEQHGVKEYWILDPEGGTIEVFFLVGEQFKIVGRWRGGQTAKAKLLPGCEVKVSEVLRAV